MKKSCLILLWLFLCFSCTKEVDFDQINDFEITPVVESSLFFFDTGASGFIENGTEDIQTGDEIEIDIFDSSFTNDNLVRVDFVFETENTLPRDFRFDIDFLDGNRNNLGISYSFITSESSPHAITFEGAALEQLKNAERLRFTLTILQGTGTPISLSTNGSLSLKSKGVFYLNIDN